jgi:hypothetical protein
VFQASDILNPSDLHLKQFFNVVTGILIAQTGSLPAHISVSSLTLGPLSYLRSLGLLRVHSTISEKRAHHVLRHSVFAEVLVTFQIF